MIIFYKWILTRAIPYSSQYKWITSFRSFILRMKTSTDKMWISSSSTPFFLPYYFPSLSLLFQLVSLINPKQMIVSLVLCCLCMPPLFCCLRDSMMVYMWLWVPSIRGIHQLVVARAQQIRFKQKSSAE